MLARIAEQRSEGIPRGEISPAARQPNFFNSFTVTLGRVTVNGFTGRRCVLG